MTFELKRETLKVITEPAGCPTVTNANSNTYCQANPGCCYTPPPSPANPNPTPIPYRLLNPGDINEGFALRNEGLNRYTILEGQELADVRARYAAEVPAGLPTLEMYSRQISFFERERLTIHRLLALDALNAYVRNELSVGRRDAVRRQPR